MSIQFSDLPDQVLLSPRSGKLHRRPLKASERRKLKKAQSGALHNPPAPITCAECGHTRFLWQRVRLADDLSPIYEYEDPGCPNGCMLG